MKTKKLTIELPVVLKIGFCDVPYNYTTAIEALTGQKVKYKDVGAFLDNQIEDGDYFLIYTGKLPPKDKWDDIKIKEVL